MSACKWSEGLRIIAAVDEHPSSSGFEQETT